MDSPVAPRQVVAVQPQDQLADLPSGRRPARSAAGGLGPVAGDEPAMPPQHRRRLHDQEHLPETITIEHLGQHPEDRTVRVIEGRPRHLPLQHPQLVAQREDLRIATIAAGQQQTDTSQQQANDERHRPKHDGGP